MNGRPKPAVSPAVAAIAGCLLGAMSHGQAYAQSEVKPVITIKKDEKPAPATSVSAPAKAETPPPSTPGSDGGDVASVTVAAERPTNRIDRQVYDVKSDAGSTNGSAADALNSVPSVAVDPAGAVTLRGSSNVQIMIDGKPSAMMQGDNRGAALSAIPAEDIESVEVINNPGAQFGNEAGGGPIINLVMRRTRRPGGFGVVNANAGTAGRYNSALSGTYNTGAFGIQGGLNIRKDGRNSVGETVRDRVDPLGGEVLHSTQNGSSNGLNDNVGANAALTYNATAKDTLAASVSFQGRTNDQHTHDHYVRYRSTGAVDTDYVRSTQRNGDSRNVGWGARWDHKGGADGETMKFDLRVSTADNSADNSYVNTYTSATQPSVNDRSSQFNRTDNRIVDFTGDYERPTQTGVLKLGYKVADNHNDFDTLYLNVDPATQREFVNTQRSNRFRMDERNYALYGSYQIRLNEKWGMLGGLRAEYTDLDIRQLTSSVQAANSYLNTIPSFFATYKWSDETNIRFSYAHRLRRPNAYDLNPFVVYRDELNVSSGNPKLKPTKTDSLELGYESRVAGMETNLRAYFRKDTDAILERRYFISDTVLLTTRDNEGGSKASGLEFSVNGKIMPGLSVNASGNLAHSEQQIWDASGMDGTRTVSSLGGRVRVNYQATPQDHIQAMVQTQGKMLIGQGVRQPNTTVNFTFRHALTPQLSLLLNVTDLFDGNKMESTVDTSVLRESSVRKFDGRVAYLGLSYRIGGFSGGARGGGGR